MTDEQLLDLTKSLIKIESTAHNPKGLQEAYDFMVRMLLDSGKEITIEQFESGGKPSFLAYRGKQRPDNFRVILNGHVDVVPGKPNQYKPLVRDGKLYGRGAYDMKAACVVLADIFCEFIDKTPYALGLQIVTDEESSGKNGTLHQIKSGVRGDFVICGDSGRSTSVHEIANEAKGVIVAEIGFKGSSSHGAYPWKGDNAVIRAAEFVRKLLDRYPVPDAESFSTTVTVTGLDTGNDAFTKVPDNAVVKLDIRYNPGEPNFRSERHFAALVEEIDPNAEVSRILDFSSPAYCDPKNPLLLSLKASAEKIEDAKFRLAKRHGTGDGRFYGDVGDQACEFGIAGEHQHGDEEYITIKAFNNYRATMSDFLAKTIKSEKYNANTKAFNP